MFESLHEFIHQPVEEILGTLKVKENIGLDNIQVTERLKLYGKNEVNSDRRKNILIEFLKDFTNPFVLILLTIVAISFILGDIANGVIVISIVILSVSLNFFQEYRAGNAAAKLRDKVALYSTVIRNGETKEVPAKEICVGDILFLNAGDLIPADARIIESKDFFVNQSSLTGEAYPVEKRVLSPDSKDGDIGSMINVLFSGTGVVTGSAKAVVVMTGVKTEFGKIAMDLDITEQENNFTKGIRGFSYFILRIVVVFVLFIFAVNGLIKHDFLQSLTFAIAVAVGLTPEFLPMIMTVTMGKGAMLMAKKGVIVKRLTSIPSLGSMNILCTDKTGTLTEDKIELVKYLDIDGNDSPSVLKMTYLNSKMQTGISNPLDQAVLNFRKIDIEGYQKIDEIPFDFTRKRMSVVVELNKHRLLIAKGAPETILPACGFFHHNNKDIKMTELERDAFEKQYLDLSKDGYRVLAVATKPVTDQKHTYTVEDEGELVLMGLTAFLDPMKPGVRKAINDLEGIGIEVKVVTGDNELVTRKACEEAGIIVKGVLTGSDITNMSELTLAARAEDTTIFARFSPSEKERVIKALKMSGNVVGYLGDGINDAPPIKAADVGISVKNAVDIASESADFILTHKSLHELKDGVIEGRTIFGNTMKYILMGLSSNFGNMFSVLGAVIFLPFLPMIPIQILLNNFLYDLSQLAIPTDNVDEEYLKTPKKWDFRYIQRFIFIFGPISSIFDFITYFVLYMSFSHMPGAFQTGWFLESLATQTLVIHIIRTRRIPFFQSRASLALTLGTLLVVVTAWILPYTVLGGYLQLVPLPINTLFVLAGIVAVYLMMAELGKKWFYRSVVSV